MGSTRGSASGSEIFGGGTSALSHFFQPTQGTPIVFPGTYPWGILILTLSCIVSVVAGFAIRSCRTRVEGKRGDLSSCSSRLLPSHRSWSLWWLSKRAPIHHWGPARCFDSSGVPLGEPSLPRWDSSGHGRLSSCGAALCGIRHRFPPPTRPRRRHRLDLTQSAPQRELAPVRRLCAPQDLSVRWPETVAALQSSRC
jgi:hypothetical protein